MREFFILINEYPWTTFFLAIGLYCILTSLGEIIHGPKKIIVTNTKDHEEHET